MDEDLTLNSVRALANELSEQFPGLVVVEEEPRESWKVTRLHFKPNGAEQAALTIVSGSRALDIHFGSDLVLETGARTTKEAAESVAVASELIRTIVSNGFLEHLWVKDGEVIAAEATIALTAGAERFRRRNLSSLRRAAHLTKAHNPW